LRLLSAAGLAPLVSGAGLLAGCRRESPDRIDAFATLLTEPEDMARIGQLWLNAQAAAPGLTTLLEDLGWPNARNPTPTMLRRWLGERQREDWITGRVVAVRDFRVARSEVLLYAVAERLKEQGEQAEAAGPEDQH